MAKNDDRRTLINSHGWNTDQTRIFENLSVAVFRPSFFLYFPNRQFTRHDKKSNVCSSTASHFEISTISEIRSAGITRLFFFFLCVFAPLRDSLSFHNTAEKIDEKTSRKDAKDYTLSAPCNKLLATSFDRLTFSPAPAVARKTPAISSGLRRRERRR